MKIGLTILIAVQLSVGCFRELHSPAPAAISEGADKLKVNQDGTVVVTGIVLENIHACEIDGACFLRLRVGDQEVDVVYLPEEGKQVRPARKISEEYKIKKGDHVKAYGLYSKESKNSMEVYSSKSFYVHVLTD
jgi:hypothetical protein